MCLPSSSKSILNPYIITSGHLSSSDTQLPSNLKTTLNINTLDVSNQNKISTSIKQRHISSTPLVSSDMDSESNESITRNIHIIEQKTPFQSKIPLIDKSENLAERGSVHHFETTKGNIQREHCMQQKRARKFKKLENELKLVKSSWDKEVRFIRYNMEILRNEIDLNKSFLSKQ